MTSITVSEHEAYDTAAGAYRLYEAMSNKFGRDKAWEFVLAYYKGAAK